MISCTSAKYIQHLPSCLNPPLSNFSPGQQSLMKTFHKEANTPLHRGAFCQSSFWWIYFYGSNKSTGKETDKSHLYEVYPLQKHKLKQWNKWYNFDTSRYIFDNMCIVYDISLYTWIGIGLMYPSKHGRDESPVSLDVPERLLAMLPYHFPFFICKC